MLTIIFGRKNLADKIQAIETEKNDLLKQIWQLKDDKDKLGREIDTLKSKKKIEEEDIKHMIKIKEEAFEIQKQKYSMDNDKKRDDAIGKIKDEYRDKLENWLIQKGKESDQRFVEILARLPNVNMEIKRGRK